MSKCCYKCPDRVVDPNCHDTCPRHAKEKEENEAASKARRRHFEYFAHKKEQCEKAKKKAGRK